MTKVGIFKCNKCAALTFPTQTRAVEHFKDVHLDEFMLSAKGKWEKAKKKKHVVKKKAPPKKKKKKKAPLNQLKAILK